MKKTLLFTVVFVLSIIIGQNLKAQNIDFYTDATRTKKITSIKDGDMKIYCRANLPDIIGSINEIKDESEYAIYLSMKKLGKDQGSNCDYNKAYFKRVELKGAKDLIEYQKTNKYIDFVIDLSPDNYDANSLYYKIETNRLENKIYDITISLNGGYNQREIVSLGYLKFDLSKGTSKYKAAKMGGKKLEMPTPTFTDATLEAKVIKALESKPDVSKVYKLVFTESKQINKYSNGAPKNRWCKANVLVKIDGVCYKSICNIYEDYTSGKYIFDGNPTLTGSTEYPCEQFSKFE